MTLSSEFLRDRLDSLRARAGLWGSIEFQEVMEYFSSWRDWAADRILSTRMDSYELGKLQGLHEALKEFCTGPDELAEQIRETEGKMRSETAAQADKKARDWRPEPPHGVKQSPAATVAANMPRRQ